MIAVFWLWIFFSSEELIIRGLEIIRVYSEKNNILAGLFFFLLMVLSVVLGPFTSVPLVPLGVFLWGEFITFWLILTGWIVGGITAYFLGKFIGYPLVVKVLPQETIAIWQNFVSQKITFFSAFLFRLAMPAETGYIFGLSGYRFRDYLLILLITEAPLAALIVWAGDALVAKNTGQFLGWIVLIVIIFSGAAYLLKKRINSTPITLN